MIRNKLKILTFFNIEILSITIIFMLLSFFGIKYLKNINHDVQKHTIEIIDNQAKITNLLRCFNYYLINDQIFFSNSLTISGTKTNINVDSAVKSISNVYNNIKIDSLIKEKLSIYKNVINIRVNKIDRLSIIPISFVNKKNLFSKEKTIIKYKSINVYNAQDLKDEISRIKKDIDFEILQNTKYNADINSQIRDEFFVYISDLQRINTEKKEQISIEIENNFRKYIITITLLLLLLFLSISFLRYDIKKKRKIEDRNKMVIDSMIKKKNNN